MTSTLTRAGTVALIGAPNAGKSRLLNALVGEELSIVTPKAQTTWRRVSGIRTSERAQMIITDTPGLLEVRDLLQRSMLEEAREALRDSDLVLLVLDATRPKEAPRVAERALLRESNARLFVAVNKTDIAEPASVDELTRWAVQEWGARAFPISAATGSGVERLSDALEESLPTSELLYPADDIAWQPVRFFVAELVREAVFERFDEEIPYSIFCTVDEFREDQEPVYIQVTLFVERASQKGIVIGNGGSAIRGVGEAARVKIERFLRLRVYLDLWVKVLPGWRRERTHLARFGFLVPEHDEQVT
jgi:GTP-binding protein Era